MHHVPEELGKLVSIILPHRHTLGSPPSGLKPPANLASALFPPWKAPQPGTPFSWGTSRPCLVFLRVQQWCLFPRRPQVLRVQDSHSPWPSGSFLNSRISYLHPVRSLLWRVALRGPARRPLPTQISARSSPVLQTVWTSTLAPALCMPGAGPLSSPQTSSGHPGIPALGISHRDPQAAALGASSPVSASSHSHITLDSTYFSCMSPLCHRPSFGLVFSHPDCCKYL